MAEPKPSHTELSINLEQARLAWEAIMAAQTIGIISHRHPDPDSIGSNLALRAALSTLGKTVNSVCVDSPPETAKFLSECANYSTCFLPTDNDLNISVDCGGREQVAFHNQYPDLFKKNFINIDHHASNDSFGTINIVQTNLSSTCEIIYQLFQFWKIKLTSDIATYLLFGLYYDTGSFMHSNTTPAVLEMASKLYQAGARHDLITKHLFQNFSEKKFHLWGDILQKIKLTSDQHTVAAVPYDDLEKFQAGSEELSGLINYLSMAPESQYALMISEEKSGQIRGSLRTTRNDVNLSELAQTLGGGGHKKASGFSLEGNISEQPYWIIQPN